MNSNTRGLLARVGAAAAAAVLATPTFALAEGVGADILIPKPAEFIPALIAFLIIWIVLAKLVWPQVLQMMDKRQQKIQDDLDAAAKSKQEAAEQAKGYEDKLVEDHREAEAIIAKAHGAVDSERHKAMIELSGSVVDLSVEIATKIIGNDLSEAEQRKLAEKYLAEVGAPDDK